MNASSPPPGRPGAEGDEGALHLAREQGRALEAALRHTTEQAADGGEREAGDFLVAYAVEPARGMYQMRDGRLEWMEPEEENLHLEVTVRDASDGRFVPGLSVQATLTDGRGEEVGSQRLPYLWHPWLYHYGSNWTVPGDGVYTLRVRVEAPNFARHDRVRGRRFLEDVEVEFTGVRIPARRG